MVHSCLLEVSRPLRMLCPVTIGRTPQNGKTLSPLNERDKIALYHSKGVINKVSNQNHEIRKITNQREGNIPKNLCLFKMMNFSPVRKKSKHVVLSSLSYSNLIAVSPS